MVSNSTAEKILRTQNGGLNYGMRMGISMENCHKVDKASVWAGTILKLLA